MAYLKLDLSDMKTDYEKNFLGYQKRVNEVHQMIHEKTGPGNDFLGWVDLPLVYDQEILKEVNKTALKIQKQSNILVVIGIGGSYLGAQAGLDFLINYAVPKVEVIFAGHHMSPTYHEKLLRYLKGRNWSINVISKSGTTTEPAIAFRFLRKALYEQFGEKAKERIYVTTDKAKGALFSLAEKEGYPRFIIPDDIGGRFSVLTPVGLLPLATAGYNIEEVIRGAEHAARHYLNPNLETNEAYQYALARMLAYKHLDKKVEFLTSYDYELSYFAEWWKQLFGESEGKEGKGILPASASFTTDLHSLGQFLQDGSKIMFQTIVKVREYEKDLKIPFTEDDNDNLNYLAGNTLSYVNHQALKGTKKAHVQGGMPVMEIELPKLNPYTFGYVVYFFEKACAMSAYLLGVNPFNQPGVVSYKENMFKLLGKPGYDE